MSSLLVAIYVGSRSRRWERESTQSATPSERSSPASVSTRASQVSEWLEVMTGTGRTMIRVTEIECLQADENYLKVFHSSGRSFLLRSTMAAAERSLSGVRFLRIHRSTIVNCDMIMERRRGGALLLCSGRTVTIGRAFRRQVAMRLALETPPDVQG